MIKLVAGLGNPGKKYEATRHNLGFMVLDLLAGESESAFKKKGQYRQASVHIANRNILLIKPQTYMNLSGVAVDEALRYSNLSIEEVLVICDDVNLPFGKLRIRHRGSDGGHNGLKSIIEETGSFDFPRLRIGVGLSEEEHKPLESYVLEKFSGSEEKELSKILKEAAEAVALSIADGIEAAQHRYN